jgi:uncharacterized DUF497 family protein
MNAQTFEWDDGNLPKIAFHRIERDEVEDAFTDPDRVARDASNTPIERRRALIGATEAGRLLTVIYTMRGSRYRVITAYDASERDARRYDRRR